MRMRLGAKLLTFGFYAVIAALLASCAQIPPVHTPTQCNVSDAQVQITLASIAYVSEEDEFDIRKKIVRDLGNDCYATAARWHLVWGPASSGGNLAYVVQRGDSSEYSVVLRGSDWEFLDNFLEDLQVKQVSIDSELWKARPGEKISTGIHLALMNVLDMVDDYETHGMTLVDFFRSEAAGGRGTIVWVTGHSLGGGLTTVVLPWLRAALKDCRGCGEILLSGYSFAGQTAGNAVFAEHFNEDFGDGFCRVVNPLDLVPQGYAGLKEVIEERIPTDVPFESPPIGEVLLGFDAILVLKDWRYEQVDTEMVLQHARAGSGDYMQQVAIQHNHNCYLALLGAPQIGKENTWCKLKLPSATAPCR